MNLVSTELLIFGKTQEATYSSFFSVTVRKMSKWKATSEGQSFLSYSSRLLSISASKSGEGVKASQPDKCKETTCGPLVACSWLGFSSLTLWRISNLGNGAAHSGLDCLKLTNKTIPHRPAKKTTSLDNFSLRLSSGDSRLCQVDYKN